SRTNLTRAFPLMKSFGFVATIFIVANRIGGTAEWEHDPGVSDDELLSVEEIEKLAGGGWTIGSHTLTHPRFSTIDLARAEEELFQSKKHLEELLNLPIRTFAYPYGVYSPEHPDLARRAGYDISFTTHYEESGLGAVKRENIHGEVHALRFLWRFRRAKRGYFENHGS
ncbi:MAG TPA: polysaccharide deacetylase family protein, partial [Nitrospiria bacterium]